MAGIYFESEPGSIVAVQSGEQGRPSPFYLEGMEAIGIGRMLIAGFQASMSTLHQLQPALDNTLHASAAGPGLADLSIQGIVPSRICAALGGGPAESGFDSLLAYFAANNIGARGRPLACTIGSHPAGQFAAFLVRAGLGQTLDVGGMIVGRFNLDIRMVPTW